MIHSSDIERSWDEFEDFSFSIDEQNVPAATFASSNVPAGTCARVPLLDHSPNAVANRGVLSGSASVIISGAADCGPPKTGNPWYSYAGQLQLVSPPPSSSRSAYGEVAWRMDRIPPNPATSALNSRRMSRSSATGPVPISPPCCQPRRETCGSPWLTGNQADDRLGVEIADSMSTIRGSFRSARTRFGSYQAPAARASSLRQTGPRPEPWRASGVRIPAAHPRSASCDEAS